MQCRIPQKLLKWVPEEKEEDRWLIGVSAMEIRGRSSKLERNGVSVARNSPYELEPGRTRRYKLCTIHIYRYVQNLTNSLSWNIDILSH